MSDDPDRIALSIRLARPFSPMALSAYYHIPEGEAFAMLLRWEKRRIVRRVTREGSSWELAA